MPNEPLWSDTLPVIDLDGLRPVFQPLADAPVADQRRELPHDFSFRRTPARRVMMDLRRTAQAVATIARLPAEGESIHILARGEYRLWDHIPAVLQLAGPEATIDHLLIVTLSFSPENIAALTEYMDAGRIKALDLLYSAYFRSIERGKCDQLTAGLASRGARIKSMRVHAKVLLLKMADGAAFTVESSANLRSHGNLEATTISRDAALYDFYADALETLFKEPHA